MNPYLPPHMQSSNAVSQFVSTSSLFMDLDWIEARSLLETPKMVKKGAAVLAERMLEDLPMVELRKLRGCLLLI